MSPTILLSSCLVYYVNEPHCCLCDILENGTDLFWLQPIPYLVVWPCPKRALNWAIASCLSIAKEDAQPAFLPFPSVPSFSCLNLCRYNACILWYLVLIVCLPFYLQVTQEDKLEFYTERTAIISWQMLLNNLCAKSYNVPVNVECFKSQFQFQLNHFAKLPPSYPIIVCYIIQYRVSKSSTW